MTGIPLYIGEWNNVVRTQVNGVFQLDPQLSGLDQQATDAMLQSFENENITASISGNGITKMQILLAQFNIKSKWNDNANRILHISQELSEVKVYGDSISASTSNDTSALPLLLTIRLTLPLLLTILTLPLTLLTRINLGLIRYQSY